MCGRYTLYTGEQAEEIRRIIDIAQRQVNGQLKLGEVFPSDRAPILVASQDKVVVRTAVWGFPGFQGKDRTSFMCNSFQQNNPIF